MAQPLPAPQQFPGIDTENKPEQQITPDGKERWLDDEGDQRTDRVTKKNIEGSQKKVEIWGTLAFSISLKKNTKKKSVDSRLRVQLSMKPNLRARVVAGTLKKKIPSNVLLMIEQQDSQERTKKGIAGGGVEVSN